MPKSFTFVVCCDALTFYSRAILSLVGNGNAAICGTLLRAMSFLPELGRHAKLLMHVIQCIVKSLLVMANLF